MKKEERIIKIIKILLIIILVSWGIIFPGCLIYAWFLPDNINYIIGKVCGVISGLSCAIFLPLFLFSDVILDYEPAEKIPFNVRDLKKYLEENLKAKKYSEIISPLDDKTENMRLYVSKPENERLTYVYYIKNDKLDKELVNRISDELDKRLDNFYNGKYPKEKGDSILLFCVNNYSSFLKKYTNRNLVQDSLNKEGYIIAVYVQNEGVLYVTKQVRGYGISFYKRLRKELFDILKIQNIEKDSK